MNRIVGIATAAVVLLIGTVAASAELETLSGKIVSIAAGPKTTLALKERT